MENTIKKFEFSTFVEMLDKLPDENSCREYLENIAWNGEPVCPHCGSKSKEHYKINVKHEFKGLYKCKDCRERFTVTVGTMFEGSHVPLRKWFIAMYIFNSHKKGISSLQLHRDLGVTQKTAWFMLHRIRETFSNEPDIKTDGITQADESYFGGKNKNRHESKKIKNAQGRSVKDKTPVFGLLTDSKVNTTVVKDTKATTLKSIIKAMVQSGSIVITDEWTAYNGLSENFEHKIINHNAKEYSRDGFHTNGIENFWSLMKRGIYGIYHSASPKQLHRYCDEFEHRYNTRKINDSDRFNLSLRHIENRLSFKKLITK
jgi:transposase-like protein